MEQKTAALQVTEKDSYVILGFSGHLQYGSMEELKKRLQSILQKEDSSFILDMSKVQNIDSTGFGLIVNFAKKVSLKKEKIVIIIVDDFVRKLFSISQCDRIFPIVDSEAAAFKMLQHHVETELTVDEY
ncbi:anti-anti-sigma factor [Sporosarcina sp. P37]|uniref:STAS domain-containing protein n=1 Tax=unclassified Sporosarcina TaxID=2647733 RepID=UPI000A17A574|nr:MULTISPECIES: STAS domain-containing protein [unclassified Sporosarcina]ARK25380.1 anti-anti-sigma factor [Sporosarcina sp. P37]PID19066.1 anti-sigma factor antagonist [Sporosarcina sp. P35]